MPSTHTVVAALRVDGLTAPAVFDGPIDNPTSLVYVEQVLVPTGAAATANPEPGTQNPEPDRTLNPEP
jgi:hypothetical protein